MRTVIEPALLREALREEGHWWGPWVCGSPLKGVAKSAEVGKPSKDGVLQGILGMLGFAD